MKLLTAAQLTRQLRSIAIAVPSPDALGIGLSGAWAEADFRKIRSAAAKVWPGIPCYATNDLETALTRRRTGAEASRGGGEERNGQSSGSGRERHRLWLLRKDSAGQGSQGRVAGATCWVTKAAAMTSAWRALQAVVDGYDQELVWPELGRRLLRALQLNEPNDLIDWAQAADKTEIASLAAEVFAAWGGKDRMAAGILAGAARSLARDAAACARRLARPGTPVQFVLTGSILLKQPRFAARVGRELRKLWPKADGHTAQARECLGRRRAGADGREV